VNRRLVTRRRRRLNARVATRYSAATIDALSFGVIAFIRLSSRVALPARVVSTFTASSLPARIV
jgi:hypothetical protein